MVNVLFALQLSLAVKGGIVYILLATSHTGGTVGQVSVGGILSVFQVAVCTNGTLSLPQAST
jgi:hypothetical protein